MDFNTLPKDAQSILGMTWSDYEPYYNNLESRTLDASTVDKWLDDWSALASYADEQFTRLEVVTTQHTADENLGAQFNRYLDEVQPAVKAADQKLKEKLLASGLKPEGFEIAIKMMEAEADIFSEKNLPLLVSQFDGDGPARVAEQPRSDVEVQVRLTCEPGRATQAKEASRRDLRTDCDRNPR